MYQDYFFSVTSQFLGSSKVSWVGFAVCYAGFDIAYNIILCFVTGAIQRTQVFLNKTYRLKKKSYKRYFLTSSFKALKLCVKQATLGGYQRWREFVSDQLSWAWPISILAIPFFIYGISKIVVLTTSNALAQTGFNLWVYRLELFKSTDRNLQIIIWLTFLIYSSTNLYRYQKQRTKKTWFSKSIFFHISRLILFDIPLAYVTVNIIFIWIDFTTALYRFLLDENIIYNILQSDMMYGLKSAHDAVIQFIIYLTILSFLPSIMLLREKNEKYANIYPSLIYLGLIATAILAGTLVYQFNNRVATINDNEITRLIINSGMNSISVLNCSLTQTCLQMSTAMDYFYFLKNMPNHFVFPEWLDYILGFRTVVLGYEIYSLFISKNKSNLSIEKIIKTIAKKA